MLAQVDLDGHVQASVQRIVVLGESRGAGNGGRESDEPDRSGYEARPHLLTPFANA
jgi:hypothetical protein